LDRPNNSDEITEPTFDTPTDQVDARTREESRQVLIAKLRLLWNRRQSVLRLTVIGLALSTAIAFVIPKRFRSTTRLMPPDQLDLSTQMLAAATSKAGAGLGAAASSLLGLKSTGELFVGILGSRTVQDDIINKFDLGKLYRDHLLEDAREDLIKNTTISEDRKSGIITIQVTDKSPQRAAAMAQEYVEELNRVVTQLNTSSAHREREFLEERLGEVKQDLESAEKGFSEFASKNTAIDIQAQGKAMIEAAAALEGESITAQTELRGLKQIYTDNNIRVRTTQARVDELQRQLQKMGGKSGSVTDANSQDDGSMYPSIRKLPLLGVSYADLYRNTKVQEAVFETLTQEYELAKVEEAKETPSVKAIDPPDVPSKKSYPHRLWIILGGAAFSCLCAAFWILGEECWKHLDPQDPGKLLALEIFGSVRAQISAEAVAGFAHSARERVRSPLRVGSATTELGKAEE
jgi:capsule polysaccharide export protein KpsE/RkpR